MTALCMTLLCVLLVDQTTKLMFRALTRDDAFVSGPGLRVRTARILLARLDSRFKGSSIWCMWITAAVTLLIANRLACFNPVLAGLLLGGSLSQALETSIRGSITDCVCARLRSAFNFADLALAGGAIGLIVELGVGIRHLVLFCPQV